MRNPRHCTPGSPSHSCREDFYALSIHQTAVAEPVLNIVNLNLGSADQLTLEFVYNVFLAVAGLSRYSWSICMTSFGLNGEHCRIHSASGRRRQGGGSNYGLERSRRGYYRLR